VKQVTLFIHAEGLADLPIVDVDVSGGGAEIEIVGEEGTTSEGLEKFLGGSFKF
jgi:hypothetical protein